MNEQAVTNWAQRAVTDVESVREAALVDVAHRARIWFECHTTGRGHMGAHDDLAIGRELARVLALYDAAYGEGH